MLLPIYSDDMLHFLSHLPSLLALFLSQWANLNAFVGRVCVVQLLK